MDSLKNRKDLETMFGFVLGPIGHKTLESMLEAGNRLLTVDPANHLSVEELKASIEKIEDRDNRDMFRRKSAMILAGFGAWDEALTIADQVEVLIERLDTLLLLATELFEANKQQEALSILAQVETIAYETRAEDIWHWQKVMVLDEAAETLLRAGYKQKAREAWEKAVRTAQAGPIGKDDDIDIALQNMVGHIASAGYLDLAEQVAAMIWIPGRKEIAFKVIAEAMKGR